MELIRRALMVALFVGHRAHERDVFHCLGGLVPAFGDRNTGNTRRDCLGFAAVIGAGLGIECLELAGAAKPSTAECTAAHLPLARIHGVKHFIQSLKLTGRMPEAATPAAPRPMVWRKCRRPINPALFIATWTVSFSRVMAISLGCPAFDSLILARRP